MMSLLALETGMLGVFCALDLFLFFVFWESMIDSDVLPHRYLGWENVEFMPL